MESPGDAVHSRGLLVTVIEKINDAKSVCLVTKMLVNKKNRKQDSDYNKHTYPHLVTSATVTSVKCLSDRQLRTAAVISRPFVPLERIESVTSLALCFNGKLSCSRSMSFQS